MWRITASGHSELGVFCEDSGRISPLGDIELEPYETHWRLWYKQNNIRRPIGKRFIIESKLDSKILL